jgi:hypothetical protein
MPRDPYIGENYTPEIWPPASGPDKRTELSLPINPFSASFADALDLAIEGDDRGIAVRLNRDFGLPCWRLCGAWCADEDALRW